MTVDTSDILLKAAEDVTQGMWCAGSRFASTRDASRSYIGEFEGIDGFSEDVDTLLTKYRCAEGSLILATRLLGGDVGDYLDALDAIRDHTGSHLMAFNDVELSIHQKSDPFEAGQQLAELFRQTAESL